MTKKKRIETWLENSYSGQYPTIRAIWYAMKPEVQKYVNDKQATRIIGQWLWKKFVDGNRTIYGAIENSYRITKRELPIVLFCEKNTLDVFGNYGDYTYANTYSSSGQSNSYEIAGLINSLCEHSEVWLYVASDFDKAGDDISRNLYEKLSLFFTVHYKRLEVDINRYETFIQPNGKTGLELDAVSDIQDLVGSDLEDFLPYEIFEEVAITERQNEVYTELITNDADLIALNDKVTSREYELWTEAIDMTYNYHLPASLRKLSKRVEVTA